MDLGTVSVLLADWVDLGGTPAQSASDTSIAALIAGVIAVTAVAVKIVDKLVDAALSKRNGHTAGPVYDAQANDTRQEILAELRQVNNRLESMGRELRAQIERLPARIAWGERRRGRAGG